MAMVFSYIRFSTKEQAKGDSLRRQLEGEDWIKRNNHTKASLTLHDLGLSAFRGKNRHIGALRTFLDLVEQNKIPNGSILLIEHLDRLSREGVYAALPIWLQILNADVKIAVLKPEERVYSKESDPNAAMISLMLPLVYFYLAHIESHRKSQNLGDAWQEKRRRARQDKTPFNKRCPSWITWNEELSHFILNDGAEAVRFMFERTTQGFGQRDIVRELQRRFPPIGTSGSWNTSFVQKVLSDRAVLGECQPFTTNEDGDRIPDGPPIRDYYPAAVEESIWYRAQTAKTSRTKDKGPSSQFVNLFVGLVTNAHDRHKMHVQRTKQMRNSKPFLVRRLVSYGHLRRIAGSDSVSIPYDLFEESILRWLSELKVTDLMESPPHEDGLEIVQQEMMGIEQRHGELEALLADPKSPTKPTALVSALLKVESRREEVRAQIERLKALRHSGSPLEDSQSILDLLAETPAEQRHDLRMRLRGKITELIDEILVKPEKHFGRVWVLAQICFGEQYNSSLKQVMFGPGVPAENVRANLDLDSSRDCQKSFFAEIAAKQSQAGEDVFDGDVPGTVSSAANAWLKIARSKMSKTSFRVVPAKIQRFVDVIGAELPVEKITAARWKKWTEHVKDEMVAGNLEFSSARVIYSRAREMVRWLIAEERVKPFQELEPSARIALG